MKIFEYIRGEDESTAKLFGFPVISQTSDYMTAQRFQSFFGGLITTSKLNDENHGCSKKDIKLFGKSLVRRIDENLYRKYYFLGIQFRKVPLIDEFKKKYFKFFDKKHDDIYILRANAGEIYLTLTYAINSLIKKNGSKNPLLVATSRYHVDMIKMICPDIPYIYIKKFRTKINKDVFKINNFRFTLLYSHDHFQQVENDINTHKLGDFHYFKSILKRLNLAWDDIEMNKASVLPEAQESMLEKVKNIGLNLDNFVFIAPEAQSCKLYDKDFWVLLIKKCREKGYDVFVNIAKGNVRLKNAVDYKKCNLSFAQAFALAKKAKKIITLRSGFTEFLLQTNTPMYVLYTRFKHRHLFNDMDIYHVISGFGLSKIPFLDKSNLYEFNMFETSQKDCLEKILEMEKDGQNENN